MKTILLTGFEPFGGDALNPSWQVAEALHGQRIGDAVVVARQMPCVFGRQPGGALHALRSALRQLKPDLVLCLGLAAGRGALSLERVAINVDDARIADNAGRQPVDAAIVARAPAAYFSTLPIKAMAQAVQAAGVPAEVSQTAGTFVCNHLFYGLMHALAGQRGVRGGFMHLPATAQMQAAGVATLALPDMVRGTQAALAEALTRRRDLRLGAGQVA